MALESIFLGVIIAVLSAFIVLWPLLNPASRRNRNQVVSSELEALLVQRDAIYATIRDLDFDHETGKVGDAEYRSQRETWVERGIQILKALDMLQQASGEGVAPVPANGPAAAPGLADIDAQIEAAIASRRHNS